MSAMESEDPVISRIGNFGRWQAKRIMIVSSVGWFTAWQMLSVSFLVPGQQFWCSPDHLNLAAGERPDPPMSFKYIPEGENETKIDHCKRQDGTTCTRWDFDRSTYPESVVSQFSLVCGNDYWRSLAQSVYMFGIMVGAIGSGILSDKFGRKMICLAACLAITIFGSFTSLSSSMPVFIFLRWCVAVSSVSLFTCGYVYCMEMVGGVWCTLIGIGLEFPWAFGYMSLPLVAWILPTWTHLQLAISLPCMLLFVLLLVPGLVPESPRWLLVQGGDKANQGNEVLVLAEDENGRGRRRGDMKGPGDQIPTATSQKQGENLNWRESMAETFRPLGGLFTNSAMRRSTLVMYYLWFTNSFVYYGLTLNSGSLLPGSLHINFVIGGALEVVAYILTIIALIYFGRRISMSVTMVFGGLCLLLTPAVPAAGKAVLGQLGKFAITGSFAMVYVYAAEIFPTVVRNVGLGSASMCARVGSIIAPFVGRELGQATSPVVPLIIFGATSLLAGILVLLLPETRNCPLPDTIEQGEAFSREGGGLAFCRKKRQSAAAQSGFQQEIATD